MQNALQWLPSSCCCFPVSCMWDFRKPRNIADGSSEFSLLQGIHVRIDVGIDISTSIRPLIIKFGKQVHLQELTQMRLIKLVLVMSSVQDHKKNLKHISTTAVPMATRLGRMVTFLDVLLPIKSHDSLIMWPCEITWQTKTTISPLSECLWPPNLAGW